MTASMPDEQISIVGWDKKGANVKGADDKKPSRWELEEGEIWAPNFVGLVGWISERARDERDSLLVEHLKEVIESHDEDSDPCCMGDTQFWPCTVWDSGYRTAVGWLMAWCDELNAKAEK